MLAWCRSRGPVLLAGAFLLLQPTVAGAQIALIDGDATPADCAALPIAIEGAGAAARCSFDAAIGHPAFDGNQHYKRMSPPDPRISEAEARGNVYAVRAATPDGAAAVTLNEATFRSHVPFIANVAQWASRRRLHCAAGQGAGWSPTRSMKRAGSTWFYASIGCAGRVCIAALSYWGIQQNGYKYGVNAVTCVAQADYDDETTARGFLESIVIARDRLR